MIPTAEEFLRIQPIDGEFKTVHQRLKEALIEFAKLHVEAALKEAHKMTIQEGFGSPEHGLKYFENAYPLTNIK